MARAIPGAVLKNVDKLEPLPVTAQALMKAISDGDASFAKLAGLIELDQAVAANVLRISRSAALRSSSRGSCGMWPPCEPRSSLGMWIGGQIRGWSTSSRP